MPVESQSQSNHPIHYQLFLGASSSALSTILTNPIDVIKCRLQLQDGKKGHYSGMIQGTIRMLKEEGIASLYKGLEPALWRSATYSAVRLGLYENLRDDLFGKLWNNGFIVKVSAGITAGAIASAFGNPFELIKVRMQAKDSAVKYTSTWQATRYIIQHEGIAALWKGMGPNLGRAASLTASQMAVYDHTKHWIITKTKQSDGVFLHFQAAMLAGIATTTITSPFDVVKTRVMQDPNTTSMKCLRQLLKTEGILGLFKGWIPNYTRLGPQTVLILLIYEKLRSLLGWNSL
jgi:hypothetical protein